MRPRSSASFVASKSAERLWHIHKQAGRPWPTLSEDDVTDYMVMEAVAIKAAKQEEKAQRQAKAQDFKQDKEGLDRLRSIAGG